MNPFIIFDNGGKTLDRFTIINSNTGDVFGTSEKPDEPGGIGKNWGNCADFHIVLQGAGWRQKLPARKVIKELVDNYINNARMDPDWIGSEVDFDSLPASLRQYILRIDPHIRVGENSNANVFYMATSPDHLSSGSGTR
jgi:hypothetical protein